MEKRGRQDYSCGDKEEAQKLVNEYKALKKMPIMEELPLVRGLSVEDNDMSSFSTAMGSRNITQNDLTSAYNQTLDREAFFYPVPQPGRGGWGLVTEEDSTNEEEENEGGGFFSWLSYVICVLVVIVAPIVAVMWLAATAITIAALTTAFFGIVGALGVAGLVGSTLNVVDDIINGNPLIEIWN